MYIYMFLGRFKAQIEWSAQQYMAAATTATITIGRLSYSDDDDDAI